MRRFLRPATVRRDRQLVIPVIRALALMDDGPLMDAESMDAGAEEAVGAGVVGAKRVYLRKMSA